MAIEEAKLLLNELPPHQRSTVLFALTTGLRLSNVVKLEWAVNLDLKDAWVKGNQSKNRKLIVLPLNKVAVDALQQLLGNHPERVFTYLGRAFTAANTKTWKRVLILAGVESFRWHNWATWHELQRLGGWKTVAMVERYAHVAPDNLAHAASRMNAVFNGYDLVTAA